MGGKSRDTVICWVVNFTSSLPVKWSARPSTFSAFDRSLMYYYRHFVAVCQQTTCFGHNNWIFAAQTIPSE